MSIAHHKSIPQCLLFQCSRVRLTHFVLRCVLWRQRLSQYSTALLRANAHFSWVSLVCISPIFSVTSSIGPLVSPALKTMSSSPPALPSLLLAPPPTLFSRASTCPSNQSTTSFLSLISASNTASCPALLKIVMSPPASIRSLTASRCPFKLAQWRAVLPEAFVRLRKDAGFVVLVESRSFTMSDVYY
jgi:hypothetical protein